jgi:hypothetical protein
VAEEGRKTAGCQRCGATIDLRAHPPLFASQSLDEVRVYLGERGAAEAGAPSPGRPAPAAAASERAREIARIAAALPKASGRANQIRLVLRRGFEAFGELTPADLDAVAAQADLGLTGQELGDGAVELGLAARSANGALVPLREGR